MTLPAISKHIKVLERAGLVTRGQQAQYRPCALDAAPLEQISTWAEQYRPVWEGRFDRMNDYLIQLERNERQANAMTNNNGSKDAVVIERSFDAPVDLIWQMWTDPEHFKEWYGPDGTTIPVAKMDVRRGGTRLVCMEMKTPDGPMRIWFTGEYREVIENERLVYTESMSDENGNVLSPSDVGMPDGHPTTTEVTRRTRGCRWPHQDGDDPQPAFPATPLVPPDGRWRSTSSPPASNHTAPNKAASSSSTGREDLLRH